MIQLVQWVLVLLANLLHQMVLGVLKGRGIPFLLVIQVVQGLLVPLLLLGNLLVQVVQVVRLVLLVQGVPLQQCRWVQDIPYLLLLPIFHPPL